MSLKEVQSLYFLKGGGTMNELIRNKDWSTTPLGEPGTWPVSLRTAVSILLNSQFPMFVWWGKELTTIYNDAYIPIAGEKHPSLLGKSGKEAWAEIWPALEPLVHSVSNGKSTWSEDQVLYMNRFGYLEETYFTFSYSPITDDHGEVIGLYCACIETTEKVLAARRLAESERNFRNMILQAPVAMCILLGPTHTIEVANKQMIELWGKEEERIMKKPVFDALPDARSQGLEDLLAHVYRTGEPFKAEERPVELIRNGRLETVYQNFVYEPYKDALGNIIGVLAISVDVTAQVLARKKIEQSEASLQKRVEERTQELQTQKSLLDNILQNSSNGISVTEMERDENGNVIDAKTILANDAAVNFTGLPKEIYLTKTACELDPNILSSPYGQTCLRTLATGEPSLIQYHLEVTGRWLELTISKMDDDHLIHIFTDVTSMKESQLQLERSVEDLKRLNTNLEEFTYAASHDMKEPIRKIHFFADRLKGELKDQLTQNQTHLFERLEHASRRMGVLIDDLLAYSHATKGVADMEEIDLNQKIKNVLEDLELEVQQKGAEIIVEPLPVIKGNRRQFAQLFQNLIGNALKYSKLNQRPRIHISSKKIKGKEVKENLPTEAANQIYHMIEIKDNGIGFNQSDAERIFNLFTRLHGNSEYKGTGVGLSIVAKVAQNHGGFVIAEGKPGEGATFKVLLPAE